MNKALPLLAAIVLCQCARQSQPAGGPKDIAPPKLEESTPENGQKNFKGKVLELTFDELIKLKDPQDEIVITPSVGTKTRFTVKKNKLTIFPENPWKDSTTYSIAFRGSVQDINESNPAEDLHLAFSTGPVIDSLKLSGRVVEVFKEKVPEKITVALYQSDTFDIFTHRPIYFTRTDKEGIFSIHNLKAGEYYLYAFEDKNKNFKADSKTERFGFLKKKVKLPIGKDSLQIEMVRVDARPIKVTSVRNTSSISIIRFNKQLDSIYLKSENNRFIYTYGDNRSEVILYKDFNKNDSIKINLLAFDSTQHILDTAVYVRFTEAKKIEESFKVSDWQVDFNMSSKIVTAKGSTNKLLLAANFDSIYFQIDTATFLNIKPEDLLLDTLKKKITIRKQLKLDLKEKTPNPVLLFGKAAFVSIDKDSSKAQDIKIPILKVKETGTLSIEIITQEKNFEVHLLNSSGAVVRSIRNKKKHVFELLSPAEYKIAVIVDSNNNRKWDVGSFYTKSEPERVILYRNSEKKYTFPIRANWEVGPLVIKF
ncbi:hypothetical protein WSM22_15220 [Cytophagales bacterium WSM2-2]|nr:hypothetical protein WSM22_15220 [Cytophagales bacterium WSM2-2]